jgi:hypothetical protein
MRRQNTLLALTLALFAMSASHAQQIQKLGLTASIWKYNSFCDFKDPESTPYRIRLSQGDYSQTFTGCMDIEKQYGHAAAIRLLVKNSGTADEEFPIGPLNTVMLHLADGKTLRPIAIRWPWASPLGGRLILQFCTELSGNRYIQVPAGSEISLVFLFKEAPQGASVLIGSMPPVIIR